MAKGLKGKALEAFTEFSQLQTTHDEFIRRFEKNKRAYEGTIEENSKAASWTHKLAPPYAEHIVETTISSIVDEQIRFKISPRPRFFDTVEEWQNARDGAKAWQDVMTFFLAQDKFDLKQRAIVLQERLAGVTPIKLFWHAEAKKKKRLKFFGLPVPMTSVEESPYTTYDGPCAEVCDVRDWFWDDNAQDIQKCGLIVHRTWVTYAEAFEKKKAGMWQNVDDLPQTRDFSGIYRERDMNSDNSKEGRIEVLEIWRKENDGKIRIYTIGNKEVLLSERDNPYWHEKFPFVTFVGQSRLFQVSGRAQMDKLRDIQDGLWSTINQRLDNLEFVNNAIAIFAEDIDDEDSVEYYPGAQWFLQRPEQVQMWSPNPISAQISIPAETMFKADMQNLAGGFPFTSSSEAQTVSASTATEASLVASLAQRSIVMAKRHLYQTIGEIGSFWMDMGEQFIREPIYPVIGADSYEEQKKIEPWILQGDFMFSMEPMTESLMRNERRAEALSLFQALVPAVGPAAMSGTPISMRRMIEHVLETYDIKDVESWFMPAPPPMAPGQQQIPGIGTPPNPENQGNGVTNQALAGGNGMVDPAQQMAMFLGSNGPQNV